jgi:(1->4)-alpha-D-glucan 1-alpha-D-glucosylmutase
MSISVPLSTYRLQFSSELTFEHAAVIVDYLARLGVSHAYASPVFHARAGSEHGYDVVDHGALSGELGGDAGFERLARRLSSHGMGLILDLVPNHMCVAGPENRWWNDVLENGPSSPFARYFDIDWKPPKADLEDKVLLPILGEQYGRVLENQEIRVVRRAGAFFAEYHESTLPLAPKTWSHVLGPALERLRSHLDDSHRAVRELSSISTAIAHLPARTETAPDKMEERQREKEIIKERLAALLAASPEARDAIDSVLTSLNGGRGDPRSFDGLECLLADQAYRLSFWRVASDEINYRRFFDVNELAAIRVETPEVYEAVHALPFRLRDQGLVIGLRVDHVDGLFDPLDYLRRLAGGGYLVVEKVLVGTERLRPDWPVGGTTGYEVLNLLNGVFVEPASSGSFRELYERFVGARHRFSEVVLASKRLILKTALSSELTVLARKLDRISEQHRFSRDFTLASLQEALAEVIACFPVYRSYVRAAEGEVRAEDRAYILAALRLAKLQNASTSESLFDFVGSVLLLDDPQGLDEVQLAERRDFVMRFQQLTGPVMAKGLEDTALYRHYPLASLNEVGGNPEAFGVEVERFHRENLARLHDWPHALTPTSTHDTKRDEDVRARINVLSEIPRRWEQAVFRWREQNSVHRARLDEDEVPDANEEYLLYQTLVGTWPLDSLDGRVRPDFVERIRAYLLKAIKEAKLRTSWISPNEGYERRVSDFVAAVLEPAPANLFIPDFIAFLRPILRAGLLNSVSQTLLKIALPGVPDFYQGTELWDFNLVDPDNRRPVDWERRRRTLEALTEEVRWGTTALASRLLADLESGELKLYVTERALDLRKRQRKAFEEGDYLPLHPRGSRERNVIAFARESQDAVAIAAAARFFSALKEKPVGADAWEDTVLRLDRELAGAYRDVFTGCELIAVERAQGAELPLASLFAHLPLALLERAE